MKTNSFFCAALILAFISNSCGPNNKADNKQVSITISGAYALYPLAQKWIQEYNKAHPHIKFNVQPTGAGKGLTDVLSGLADIGMFSRAITDAEKSKGIWWIDVCKEAVVPVVNSQNPYIDILRLRGLTKEEFKSIFVDNSPSTWDSLFKINSAIRNKINVYTRADASGAAESWAAFFGKKQQDLKGLGVAGDPAISQAVKRDKNAIGYNNTAFIFEINTGEKVAGIEVVPIDQNGNGRIDADENFYDDISTFLDAVNTGKFPSPPARDLYFITNGRPQKQEILDFFEWVLRDGQKFIQPAGYVPLDPKLVRDQVNKVAPGSYEN